MNLSPIEKILPLRGGLVCSMNPKPSYQPGRLDAGECYLKGRKSGYYAGIQKGRMQGLRRGRQAQEFATPALLPTLNVVELRPYARRYGVPYAGKSRQELVDAIQQAMRQ
jgi:hypothetical protein